MKIKNHFSYLIPWKVWCRAQWTVSELIAFCINQKINLIATFTLIRCMIFGFFHFRYCTIFCNDSDAVATILNINQLNRLLYILKKKYRCFDRWNKYFLFWEEKHWRNESSAQNFFNFMWIFRFLNWIFFHNDFRSLPESLSTLLFHAISTPFSR